MRKGEATRARIVDEAARLAARRGLTAVSLADVAEAVGLSKSGLFKHFDSKEAMQAAVIDRVVDQFAEATLARAEGETPARRRLEAIFAGWMDWEELDWTESGCPVVAFSVELDGQPGALRDQLRARLRDWREAVTAEFQAMNAPPLSDAQAQSAYFQMKSFALGAVDSGRMMGDANARAVAEAAFRDLLDRTEARSAA